MVRKNRFTVARGEVFRSLGTTCQDWFYNGRTVYASGRCELCDTPLVWKHALEHGPTGRILWIGCECVHEYYQSYQPNGLQRAIELLRSSTGAIRARQVKERLEKFKLEEPTVAAYLLDPANKVWGRKITVFIDETCTEQRVAVNFFRMSMLRKGYLSSKEMLLLKSSFDKEHA